MALLHTKVAVLYCDPAAKIVWAENIPASWTTDPVVGRVTSDFIPPEADRQLMVARMAALESHSSQKAEIAMSSSDGQSWFDVWVDCDRDQDDEPKGTLTTLVEITDRRRREQTLRALLREVAHRSKNLLAIIQSIATQTGRHSTNMDMFLTRFRGRLQSLASTQDLVTSSNWRGAGLCELVASQVGRYVTDPQRRVNLQGERPYLNPNASLHIGLALHELAVNSVSYGALSKPDGHISLTATRNPDASLMLEWCETIDLNMPISDAKHFGSTALEKVVPASLNATASLLLTQDRLIYRLSIPPENLAIE